MIVLGIGCSPQAYGTISDATDMPVDVLTEILISRPRHVVAEFAADPTNAPAWYRNIESVQWETEPPVATGSRISFVANFLGRRLAYTYEIREFVPG
jgi:hypothetical protein